MIETFFKGKNICITGATGLLGSNLTKKLIELNANITILQRDYVAESLLIKSEDIKKINVVRGEIEDFELLLRILNEYEIEFVFHLGAQTIVPIANNNPLSTFDSNIKGTWNLLEACRIINKNIKIIVASTDKVYGTQEKLPYTEEMELKGIFPYDVSKICTELIAKSYSNTYELPITIIRCGNMFGPGDLNFNRIVPGCIKSAILNETLEIRSNGKFIRDYVFIDDVVDGLLKVAENIEKTKNDVFNISTDNRLTVIDVVNKISQITKKEIKIKILNKAKNEIRDQYLSSEKIFKKLGWKAKNTFEEGIKKTLPWYENYFKNF